MLNSSAYRAVFFDIATASSEIKKSIKIIVNSNHLTQRVFFFKETFRIFEVKYIKTDIFVLQEILHNHLKNIFLIYVI